MGCRCELLRQPTTPREKLAAQQLHRLADSYPLNRLCFSGDVRIEFGAVPHSHPVLTLNTRYLADDDRMVTTFIHEQLHWGVSPLTSELVDALVDRYPKLPLGEQ